MDVGSEILTQSRAQMRDLRRRLRTTLERLSPEDLSWRPNPDANSAANLVLHICGNLGQRFVAGFGGAVDGRDRDGEFAQRGAWTGADLAQQADAVFEQVDAFLASADANRLGEERAIQGRTQSLLALLLATVAHTAEHVGQIIYIAKARQGEGFASLSIPLPGRR